MRNLLILCLSILLLSISTSAQLSGPLSGVLPGDSTYTVIGDISIAAGDSLIIEAGAELIFHYNTSFAILGYLHAAGTELDSIKFITSQDSIWGGIDFGISASDSSRLEYCVITGGLATGTPMFDGGGGIYCNSSSPSISNSTISENSADYGGGIYCRDSSPSISNCTISENSADYGGGIFCWENSNPSISDCIIRENSAGSYGGGITCWDSSSPSVFRCTISENTVNGNGGGIYVEESNQSISNCVISENTAGYSGGGIWCFAFSSSISNCTISGNTAGSSGSGICCSFGSPDIVNTIVAGNFDEYGLSLGFGANPSITFSDFYNNEGGNFSSSPGGLGQIITTNANGDSCDSYMNTFLDPLFQATTGDSAFRLTADSPCIDAGNPVSPLNPDSTISDIGAYYFWHGAELSGALNGTISAKEYHVVGDISVSAEDSLIIEAGAILIFDDDVQFDIDGYLHAAGTITDSIKFKPIADDSTWGGIDFNDSASDSSRLDYCFITGSNSSGIHCDHSSPSISNCTICGNSLPFWRVGGGIFCSNSSSPFISDCIISENSAGEAVSSSKVS